MANRQLIPSQLQRLLDYDNGDYQGLPHKATILFQELLNEKKLDLLEAHHMATVTHMIDCAVLKIPGFRTSM
jgi:hypothetical protein